MAEEIVLSVPPTLSAVYVVPTSRPPDDVGALAQEVAGVLGDPLSGLVQGMLSGPLLDVEVHRAADLPPTPDDVLALMGAGESARALTREATHAVVVRGVYQPGWPPAHEWGAAAVAGGIAARLDVPVLDVVVPRLRSAKEVLEGLPRGGRPLAVVDWLQVLQSDARDGLLFTTKGLARFGLPELACPGVPPQLAGPWTAVLNGLAQVLLRTYADALAAVGPDDEQPAFVTLPAEVEVTTDDLVRAHGADPDAAEGTQPDAAGQDGGAAGGAAGAAGGVVGGAARLALRLDPATDPDADSFLVVGPTSDHPSSAGEFMVAVCTALFGGAEPDVIHAPHDDAMAGAVEQARRTLPDVRRRYVEGGIPPGSRLLVKHGLDAGDGTSEYVWAYVTDWQEPGVVVGRCGSDADSDPAYRVGRPVRLDAEDVVDWAVWVDGTGIVEGGFTNALLDDADG